MLSNHILLNTRLQTTRNASLPYIIIEVLIFVLLLALSAGLVPQLVRIQGFVDLTVLLFLRLAKQPRRSGRLLLLQCYVCQQSVDVCASSAKVCMYVIFGKQARNRGCMNICNQQVTDKIAQTIDTKPSSTQRT